MEILSPLEYEMSQRSKFAEWMFTNNSLSPHFFSLNEGSTTKRFQSDRPGLLEFKEWVLNKHCELAALESTGLYWYSLYSTLEDHIKVIVANPYLTKIFRER